MPSGDFSQLSLQYIGMVLHEVYKESSLTPLMRTNWSFWASGKAIVWEPADFEYLIIEDGRPQEYANEIVNSRLVQNSPAPPVRFLASMELGLPRVKHIHVQLRNTPTHCVQQFINQCPDLASLTIERWTFHVRNIFSIPSVAGNFIHLNVSVDSRPTREERDRKMDSGEDGNIDDDAGLDRGITTLQHANVIFTKRRPGEGLTPRAVLQALAQPQDLREAVLKDVVLGQRILLAKVHSEANKIPYFPYLERLEINPADAMVIKEVARISILTYLRVGVSCSYHTFAQILSDSLRDFVHLQTLKITNTSGHHS